MEQLLYWLVGMIGMPLITWLKELIGIEGKWAMALTALVATVLACAALFISKSMELTDFTWANLAAVFGQVLAAATLAYKLLVKESK